MGNSATNPAKRRRIADRGLADRLLADRLFDVPVRIKNSRGEYLFNGRYEYDSDRRFVFTWLKKGGESDDDMRWQIVNYGDYYGILSLKKQEWLYVGYPKLTDSRRYALTWKAAGDPQSDPDMQWTIHEYDGFVGIKSVAKNEWMYSGRWEGLKFSNDRYHVCTWGGGTSCGGGDPSVDRDMRWTIEAADDQLMFVRITNQPLMAKACVPHGGSFDDSVEVGYTHTQELNHKFSAQVSYETGKLAEVAFGKLGVQAGYEYTNAVQECHSQKRTVKKTFTLSEGDPAYVYQTQIEALTAKGEQLKWLSESVCLFDKPQYFREEKWIPSRFVPLR